MALRNDPEVNVWFLVSGKALAGASRRYCQSTEPTAIALPLTIADGRLSSVFSICVFQAVCSKSFCVHPFN